MASIARRASSRPSSFAFSSNPSQSAAFLFAAFPHRTLATRSTISLAGMLNLPQRVRYPLALLNRLVIVNRQRYHLAGHPFGNRERVPCRANPGVIGTVEVHG